jgi:hypothetical protein
MPQSIQSGDTEELARFVYHRPNSVMFALEMLGLFFWGLGTLWAAPVFTDDRLGRTLRGFFVAFGLENIVGLLAYALDGQIALLIYNLAMTLTSLGFLAQLTIYFKRLIPPR